ncbi:hypothetical protein CEXT_808901 [Caerostris extrusa]|uniref:Uncharacterized protein n=1 Tax=Caerostris extrusa TaxID=172846 RepID=A0AAV4X190_CAEEX|nr:hypothetical protein CEXT_808901 [Caerostris extrusa]
MPNRSQFRQSIASKSYSLSPPSSPVKPKAGCDLRNREFFCFRIPKIPDTLPLLIQKTHTAHGHSTSDPTSHASNMMQVPVSGCRTAKTRQRRSPKMPRTQPAFVPFNYAFVLEKGTFVFVVCMKRWFFRNTTQWLDYHLRVKNMNVSRLSDHKSDLKGALLRFWDSNKRSLTGVCSGT